MAKQKPTLAKGTRDFGPGEMTGRLFIFDTLRSIFQKYGFQPIETPAIEQLAVLTGKYGEEGDRLIFKILNSGEFLDDAKKQGFDFHQENASAKLLPLVSEKALRYDLTVPFARFVVMNQNAIQFPFKRFQIQPVWRADKPQRGRYREFYQCDVDVVGSNGLLNELELVRICEEGFGSLRIEDVTLRLNNRKLLEGIAAHFGASDRFVEFITILDKLDKVGEEGVFNEWEAKGFNVSKADFAELKSISDMDSDHALDALRNLLSSSENLAAQAGLDELEQLFEMIAIRPCKFIDVKLDIFLARGLGYYTGTIFEAITKDFPGSILGGGRYDNLTGVFGLNGVSGVGISFGADRIYDVLKSRGILDQLQAASTKLLLINFGGEAEKASLRLWMDLIDAEIPAQMYPEAAKPAKQFKYADSAGFSHVLIIGENEVATSTCNLKNLSSGIQETYSIAEVLAVLKSL